MARAGVLAQIGANAELPSLAPSVSRILAAIDQESTNASDIADMLIGDMAISGRLLALANSVFHNPGGNPVASLNEAIPRLGFRTVRDVVLTTGVIDVFAEDDCPFDYIGFWKHCVTTAIAAGTLAERSPKINHIGRPGDNPYFTCGLMHDVGIFVLVRHLGKRYAKILKKSEKTGTPLHVLEQDILGFDHAEVGAELMVEWGLPEDVQVATAYHHNPGSAPSDFHAWAVIVHLADWIANHQGHGLEIEGQLGAFVESSWYDLGLEVDEIPDVIEDFTQAADRSSLMLSR